MNNDRELREGISKLQDFGYKFCRDELPEDEKEEMNNLLPAIYSYILNQQNLRSVQTAQINRNRREILSIFSRAANSNAISMLSSCIDNLWQYSGAKI